MIKTMEGLGVAAAMTTELLPAMGTDVEKTPDLAILSSHEQDRPAGNGAGQEVVRLRQLRVMADEKPASSAGKVVRTVLVR